VSGNGSAAWRSPHAMFTTTQAVKIKKVQNVTVLLAVEQSEEK
jgi:hypothetical protein